MYRLLSSELPHFTSLGIGLPRITFIVHLGIFQQYLAISNVKTISYPKGIQNCYESLFFNQLLRLHHHQIMSSTTFLPDELKQIAQEVASLLKDRKETISVAETVFQYFHSSMDQELIQ